MATNFATEAKKQIRQFSSVVAIGLKAVDTKGIFNSDWLAETRIDALTDQVEEIAYLILEGIETSGLVDSLK